MTRPTRIGNVHRYIIAKEDGGHELVTDHEVLVRAFTFALPWGFLGYTPPPKDQDGLWEMYMKYLNTFNDDLAFNTPGVTLTWVPLTAPDRKEGDGYVTVERRPATQKEMSDESIGIFPEDNSKPAVRWPES